MIPSSLPETKVRPLTEVFHYFPSMPQRYETATKRPWRNHPVVWATSGHLLVALVDDGHEADATPARVPEKYVERLLRGDPEIVATVRFDALAEFAGDFQPTDEECEECDGTGRDQSAESITCQHCDRDTYPECKACGGDGKPCLEERQALIAGILINLNLVAFGLACVPASQTVEIGRLVGGTPNYPCLSIVGPTWRIVVAAMQTARGMVPEFKPLPKGPTT